MARSEGAARRQWQRDAVFLTDSSEDTIMHIRINKNQAAHFFYFVIFLGIIAIRRDDAKTFESIIEYRRIEGTSHSLFISRNPFRI